MKRPSRNGKPGIERTRQAAIGPVGHDTDAGIGLGETLEDLGRPVGRSIVDADQFEVGAGLAQDGLDGLGQVGFAVMDRQHDADRGHCDGCLHGRACV
ncbi:MAG: hypothetical protein VW935_05755 [Novosphingobium sp.]